MALVIVLALLVLIFAMAVAFLGSIATERASSATYATNTNTRQLGDMAVRIVQAQIQQASTQTEGTAPLAWASQPGLVRTFQQNGDLHTIYKLYSDSIMTGNTLDLGDMTNQLSNWKTDTAHFTDLNAPVGVDRDGNNAISQDEQVFPILNPAGIANTGGKSPKIDGFSILSAPAATTEQPAPMPVRWLYVLRDGTLAAATGSGATASIATATKENPIVGRIAFWTDDETCKLNINTAAHGSRWDIPRIMAEDEALPFVRYQPTIREFQRYPGHPATTSLAPVFGSLFGVDPLQDDPYASLNGSQEKTFADFIYRIVPRVEPGGSELGTKKVSETALIASPLTLDNERLYASLDELIFNPLREAQSSDGMQIDRPTLEAAKFFLTAHSRAPELNLFQKPRISMWPINDGTNNKLPSSLDRLIAFCSTVNGIPYYLQRSEPDDPGEDIAKAENGALRDYLRDLLSRPVPGFGSASFADKYETAEANQISTEILDYIRSSNLMPVDTYGATKFSTDVTGRNHVNPDVPDAVGTRGGQVSPVIDDNGATKGFGRIPTISRAVLHFFISDIKAQPTAANPGDPPPPPVSVVTGRRPVPVSGADTAAYLPRLNALNHPRATAPKDGENGVDYDIETEAVLYFDFFDPMAGYPVSDYNFDLLVEFGSGWTVTRVPVTPAVPAPTSQPLSFPTGVRVPMRYNGTFGYDFSLPSPPSNPRLASMGYGYRLGGGRSIVSSMMGFLGFSRNFRDTINNVTGKSGSDGLNDFYQLVSLPVRLHATMKTVVDSGVAKFAEPPKIGSGASPGSAGFQDRFAFSGGAVTVKLVVNKTGSVNPGSDFVIQEFDFQFPAFTKPVPSYVPSTPVALEAEALANTQAKQMAADMDFSYRIRGNPSVFAALGTTASGDGEANAIQTAAYLTQPGDIIVSLEPVYGDPRLIAGKTKLSTSPLYSGGRIAEDFVPHEDYYRGVTGPVEAILNRHAYSFRVAATNYRNASAAAPYGPTSSLGYPVFGRFVGGLNYGRNALPNLPSRWLNGVPVFSLEGTAADFLPDFDTGMAYMQDGPYVNRADEGAVVAAESEAWPWSGAAVVQKGSQAGFYSPNKQIAGAGMLGSLPTGVVTGNPWQTLLFRPDPGEKHPGSVDPPDYLMLDLFWMPVVEPYAISEPLSTAGKINLNHQIIPFAYINRSTALRGLLLKEEIPAVLDNVLGSGDTDIYKRILILAGGGLPGLPPSHQSRNRINLSATLEAIDERFKLGSAYRSETEICTIPLIPIGESYSSDFAYESTWWKARRATGDNMRERPYTNIVPRLTTKSNSYTVHYRVQTLAKRPNSDPAIWEEGNDLVSGEYRGSSTIERFINPNISATSWTSADTAPLLGSFYQWRILNTSQFAP